MTRHTQLTTADTRIHISRRAARWDNRPATVADAMDFWSFAAGAANVVMQLSWPGVGYGVVESKVESGSLIKHPWKRARTTFSYLAVAILGRSEDRTAFREAVDVAHRQVRSGPKARCPTTLSTATYRCGLPHAFSSAWKIPTDCCAAR